QWRHGSPLRHRLRRVCWRVFPSYLRIDMQEVEAQVTFTRDANGSVNGSSRIRHSSARKQSGHRAGVEEGRTFLPFGRGISGLRASRGASGSTGLPISVVVLV